MTKINLSAKLREEVGKKVKKFRKEGMVPAVVYGEKTDNKNLWVDGVELRKVYENAGENTIIELGIGEKDKAEVLIHDIQRDPLSGDFSHVDFFQVQMDKKIESEVPVEFVGDAPAVKEMGGTLVKSLDEISVRCLPADLPSQFEVDLSALKTFDDYVKVKHLPISEKVEILLDPETIITSVSRPRSEEEMEALDEKVEEDVSKVEGVEKEEESAEEEGEKKEEAEKE